jgi:CRISPR/Cas system-associated endoribonuclease Cas2
MSNPPICMLITWDSRNWRRLKKAVELCKDYALTRLSKRVCIGTVRKNELPELQQKLRQLFFGNKDKLFLFMLCKSCLEVSSIPLAVQTNMVRRRKFEIVG